MAKKLEFLILVAIGVTSFSAILVIPPALPWMIEPLGATPESINLIVSAYNLPGIFLLPFYGLIIDHIGRKEILVPSLIVFSVSGILIAFAPSLLVAVMFRLIQGAMGVILFPLVTTLIGDLYAGDERKKANGIVNSAVTFAGVMIPILSGLMAVLDWRLSFFLFGMGFIPVVLVLRFLRLPMKKEDLGVEDLNLKSGMNSIKQGFGLLKDKRITMVFLISLVVFGVDSSVLFIYYPIYVEQAFSVTQVDIGLAMACLFGVETLSAMGYGWIALRIRDSVLSLTAVLVFFVGLFMLPFHVSFYGTLVSVSLMGCGFGLFISAMMNELLEHTPAHIRGTGSSLYQASIQLGSTVVPILSAGILALTGQMLLLFGMNMVFIVLLMMVQIVYHRSLDTTHTQEVSKFPITV